MPDKKIVVFAFFFLMQFVRAQSVDSIKATSNHKAAYLTTTLSMYSVGSLVLYNTWYKPYNTGKFRTFNDRNQWLGMDKTGHFVTSWWISSFIRESAELSGFTQKQSRWMGVLYPTLFMTSIEVMDGFSDGWGFSTADLLSNFGGIAFSYIQSESDFWDQFNLKYSWNSGSFSQYRPGLLGSNIPERMLKNYNEQTYWLSIPLNLVHHKIPSWLCISLGYGAQGLLGGTNNVWDENGKVFNYSNIPRERQYSLSLDVDLRKLKVKGKAWKLFTSAVRWVKIPAPTLYFRSQSGVGFSPIRW
jgi:uncharacterized protein YfiM (DUF2279 family)